MSSPAERLAAGLADRYRLERKLGEGGMATVYLAEDLRHHRKVAIKVLHPELSAVIGAERFLKEIEVTASLQHPHILPLFDSGESDGLLFYVMPFIEGETLRARLERERQLPIADAVRITRQVAQALDYAHRRGIVHRDIKPENILLHEESALVADFGIALAVQQAGGSRLTQTGMSLGTPQYMSPEQAMGERSLDLRTDIYALGAVAYEMLAGEPPFTGATAQAIVAKVITEKPAPLASHRDTVPAHVAAAVHLALSKLAADRWASAREFATALEEGGWAAVPAAGRTTVAIPAAARPPRARRLLGAALLALAALGAGTALGWMLRRVPPVPETRLQIFSGAEGLLGMAFAPDGRTIVVATPAGDRFFSGRLYLRRLDRLALEPIAGVERANHPTFSPDGRQLAYLRTETATLASLWRVALDGAAPVRVVEAAWGGPYGAPSWGDDGYIYFTAVGGVVSRVPATGGPVDSLAAPEAGLTYGQPDVLPRGKGVLVTRLRLGASEDQHEFGVWDPATRQVRVLGKGYSPHYLPTGHLLYVDGNGTLFRVPFDVDRLQLDGQPVAVASHVRRSAPGIVVVAASPTGDFAYRADTLVGIAQRRLVLVSRSGVIRPFPLPPDLYNSFRLSPDGRRLVLEVTRGTDDGGDLFVVDVGDSTPRLLSRKGVNNYPAWSPDGRRIGYGRLLDGERDLAWQAVDGSDTARVLLRRPGEQFEMEFVPGTDRMLVRDGNATGGAQDLDILEFRVTGDSIAPFASVRGAIERAPRVSPDGRWVAYISNETGRDQVFVRPYPDPGTGASWQVSEQGGLEPVWSRKGTELFYKAGESMMVASVRTTPTFSVQSRRALFAVPQFVNNPWHARYDVMPGDTTLLMIDAGRELDESNARTILVQHVPLESSAAAATR